MKKTLFAFAFTLLFLPFSGVAAADEQSRFVQQCIKSGDTEENCEAREEKVRSEMRELKKLKRLDFVNMILTAKRHCRAEHADPAHVRLCFRVNVRDNIKAMILELRELKRDCREEGSVGFEIMYCALSEYLDFEGDDEEENGTDDSDDENEEENGGGSDDDENGDDEEENEDDDDDSDDTDDDEEEGEEANVEFGYSYDAEKNVTLTWQTENVTSCTASSDPENTDWNGELSENSGEKTIVDVDEVTTFTITCTPDIEGEDDIVVEFEVDTSE